MGVVTLTSTPPPGYALLYNGPPGQGGVVDHSSLGSFPYVEEIDGYRESWRSDGAQQVTRCFKVRWGGRKSFVDYMLGWSTTLGGGGSVTLTNGPPPPEVGGSGNTLQSSPPATTPAFSRQIPDQVPEDGFRHLYCSEVNMVGGKGIIGNNPNVQVFLADGSQALDANGNAVTKPMIAYSTRSRRPTAGRSTSASTRPPLRGPHRRRNGTIAGRQGRAGARTSSSRARTPSRAAPAAEGGIRPVLAGRVFQGAAHPGQRRLHLPAYSNSTLYVARGPGRAAGLDPGLRGDGQQRGLRRRRGGGSATRPGRSCARPRPR